PQCRRSTLAATRAPKSCRAMFYGRYGQKSGTACVIPGANGRRRPSGAFCSSGWQCSPSAAR
ncbi:unnamed protein product, partial [Amoebophrya sp. A25]